MKNTKGELNLKKSKSSAVKKTNLKDLASVSLIFFLIDKFSNFLYNSVKDSFFGSILTAYSKEQNAFNNSYIKSHFSDSVLAKRYFRNIRRFLSKYFESSYILNKLSDISSSIVAVPLRTLGNSLFSFGIYVVIIYLLRLFLPVVSAVDISYAMIGIIVCIIAIPMLLSKDNIANAIGKSAILGIIFREALGYREETFRQRTNMSKVMSGLMIFGGIILGILTLAVHPLWIVVAVAALIGVSIVFTSPEIGVIFALFIIPFLSFFEHSASVLGLLVLLISVSLLVKLIRGKRILRFEIIDLSIVFFGIIIFFSGAISAGGIDSFKETVLTCGLILGYFLVVNLVRTEIWIKRCIGSLVISGTIVSTIGIVQYILGVVSNKAWLDTSYFFDIKGRVVSLFDNPNILAVYLVMILPFALYMLIQASKGRAKLLGTISVASIILCIVLTWSRGAWVAAIICIAVFLLIYSRKTLRYVFCGCIFVPFLPFLLPQSVIRRFTSIGDLSDSSTMYRVYTWKGSLRVIGDYLFSGIGYGTNAFQTIYPQYAYAGIESAEHSHSLFLQILIGTGIAGIIVFAIFVFLFTQMSLENIKNTNNRVRRLITIAALCAVLSAIIFGLFDYTWYNYRILFLFWTIVAIGCACVRVGNDEERRHSIDVMSK